MDAASSAAEKIVMNNFMEAAKKASKKTVKYAVRDAIKNATTEVTFNFSLNLRWNPSEDASWKAAWLAAWERGGAAYNAIVYAANSGKKIKFENGTEILIGSREYFKNLARVLFNQTLILEMLK